MNFWVLTVLGPKNLRADPAFWAVAIAQIGHSTAGWEPLRSRLRGIATLIYPSHPFYSKSWVRTEFEGIVVRLREGGSDFYFLFLFLWQEYQTNKLWQELLKD